MVSKGLVGILPIMNRVRQMNTFSNIVRKIAGYLGKSVSFMTRATNLGSGFVFPLGIGKEMRLLPLR